MTTTKQYEAIIWAKEQLFDLCQNTDWVDYPDSAAKLIRFILSRKNRSLFTILQKQAIVTVLVSGAFNEWGGFSMPATACCCQNFASVKKDLAKKRQIKLLVYGDTEDFLVSVFQKGEEKYADLQYQACDMGSP